MARDKISKLFVYGTLMIKHAGRTRPGSSYVKEASVVGTLVDLGAFPGYLMGGSTVIKGELLELDLTTDILDHLDRYEGFNKNDPDSSLYIRAVTETQEGDLCYTYVYNRDHGQNAEIVKSGDWHNKDAEPVLVS